MTGTTLQLVNGIMLLVTFFGARLVYGSYISVCITKDIARAVQFYRNTPNDPPLAASVFQYSSNPAELEVVKYAPANGYIPLFMVGSYLASNLVLHFLNIHWFGLMIGTLRRRFDRPFGTRSKEEIEVTTTEKDGVRTTAIESTQTELKQRPVAQRMVSDVPPAA
jgi:TLC domain